MAKIPKYDNYRLIELYQALNSIAADKYPEAFAALEREIYQREPQSRFALEECFYILDKDKWPQHAARLWQQIENLGEPSSDLAHSDSIPNVRPWVRYFARALDMCLLTTAFAFLCLILGIRIGITESLFLGIVLAVIWLFVEPAFLCRWGATPGKWLLRTRVVQLNGTFLTYDKAFKRSVCVWAKGHAFYIPVAVFVANVISYKRLTDSGTTPWDEAGAYTVEHARIGVGRVFAYALLLVAALEIGGWIIYLP